MAGRAPCEAFAAEEQWRADGLAARCVEIASTPGHASAGSLPLYQAAYRSAAEAAAETAAQPERS